MMKYERQRELQFDRDTVVKVRYKFCVATLQSFILERRLTCAMFTVNSRNAFDPVTKLKISFSFSENEMATWQYEFINVKASA